MNKTALVVGGSGMIGSRTCRALLAAGRDVIVFDRVIPDDAIPGVTYLTGDVTSQEDVARSFHQRPIDSVIHLASLLTPVTSANPRLALAINCEGFLNVLEAASIENVNRVVWASSGAVFGRYQEFYATTGKAKVGDDGPFVPRDLYGAMKLMDEVLAEQFVRDGLDVVGLRPVATYAPVAQAGSIGILLSAISELVADDHARVRLPWQRSTRVNTLFVDDCAELFAEVAVHPGPMKRTLYNLGTGDYVSVEEIMSTVQSLIKRPTEVTYEGDELISEVTGSDVPKYDTVDVSSDALRDELSWTPKFSLSAGLAVCVERFSANAIR